MCISIFKIQFHKTFKENLPDISCLLSFLYLKLHNINIHVVGKSNAV